MPRGGQRPTPPKLPRVNALPMFPRGPKELQVKTTIGGGPGQPPPGFGVAKTGSMATVSSTEWVAYWALSKVFDNPRDPRVGPFIGGPPDWLYQEPFAGGRGSPGGSVVDFVVTPTAKGRPVLIRIVTEHWHVFTSSSQQAKDLFQYGSLLNFGEVVDVYDDELLATEDGSSAVIAMKDAVGLLQSRPTFFAPYAQRARPLL
jgi:hypothetical protein